MPTPMEPDHEYRDEIERLTKELNSCKDRSMKQFVELAHAKKRLRDCEANLDRLDLWMVEHGAEALISRQPVDAALAILEVWWRMTSAEEQIDA